MSINHLSVSSIELLFKCPKAFEYRYIDKIKTPPKAGMARGKAVDAAVNVDLEAKMSTGSLLPEEQVIDTARDTLEREWVEVEDTEDKPVDEVVSLARLYHGAVAPKVEPTAVQHHWRMHVNGMRDLVGFIDVMEPGRIRDTKTAKKSPRRDEADVSFQLDMYSLYDRVANAQTPTRHLDYLVANKTPKLVQLESAAPTLAEIQPTLERIAAANKAIDAGIFPPAPTLAWWCSASWCGYHARCPYAKKPTTISLSGLEDKCKSN